MYTNGTVCGCEFSVGQRTVHKRSTHEMHPVYGDNCFSWENCVQLDPGVYKGRQSIKDREHPAEVSTEATVQHVVQIIHNDRRVSIDNIVCAVGCSHGTAYNIMHEQLKFRKVCERWVPCRLTEEQKMFRMGLSLQNLNQNTKEGEDLWHELLWETSLGCTTFNQNRKDLPWNGNIPPRQQKKVQDYSINPQGYAHCVLGHARDHHTAKIPASQSECNCHVILHHSVGTPTGYSL